MSHRCFDAANKALEKAGKNTRLSLALDLGADVWRMVVATEKVNPRLKGKPVVVTATFCPFCGEKLHEPKQEADSKRAT
jgi:hypothetical protein